MRGKGKRRAAGKHARPPPEAIKCAVCGVGDGKYKCPKCRAPFCCVQCFKDHKGNHCPALKADNASTTADAGAAATNKGSASNEKSEYLSPKELQSDIPPRRKRPRRSDDADDDDDDEPGWGITDEMKERLRRSSWLQKELQDGGLRQLIDRIDGASDDEEEGDGSNGNGRACNHQRTNKSTANVSARELALARTRHSKPKFASFVDRMLLTVGVLQPADGGREGGGGGSIMDVLEGPSPLVLAPVLRRPGAVDEEVNSDAGSSVGNSESSEDSDGD